jgi:hypothetical protein
VSLDGKYRGKSPLSVDSILATRHWLRVTLAGWLADTSELVIPARDTLSKAIQLSRVFRDVTIAAVDARSAYFHWECNYGYGTSRSTDMIDGNLATSTTVGVESSCEPDQQASLHWVTLSLPEERYVTAVGLVNSNEALRRLALFQLRSVQILFPDGTSQEMHLQSRSDMQYCSVVPPKKTSQITIKPSGLRRRGGHTYMFGIAEIEVQGYDASNREPRSAPLGDTHTSGAMAAPYRTPRPGTARYRVWLANYVDEPVKFEFQGINGCDQVVPPDSVPVLSSGSFPAGRYPATAVGLRSGRSSTGTILVTDYEQPAPYWNYGIGPNHGWVRQTEEDFR